MTPIDHVTLSIRLCNDPVPGHSMNVFKLHYIIIQMNNNNKKDCKTFLKHVLKHQRMKLLSKF